MTNLGLAYNVASQKNEPPTHRILHSLPQAQHRLRSIRPSVSEHTMRTTVTILLSWIVVNCYSTNQIEDILYWNNDTLFLYESPLEQISGIKFKLQADEDTIWESSDCWRGYVAKWQIIDNKLYLLNVNDCNSGKNLNYKLEKTLDRQFTNGKMLADWVNKTYWTGKDLVPEQTLYISVYKHEYNLTFEKGDLVNLTEFHFRKCDYDNEDKWTEFILNNLNWEELPETGAKNVNISAYIEPDNEGNISKVTIEHSDDYRYNVEIIKAIRKLPCMTIYFNEGKIWDVGQEIYLTINIENINKYVR